MPLVLVQISLIIFIIIVPRRRRISGNSGNAVNNGIANLLNPDIRRIDTLKQELEDRTHYLRPYTRLLPGEQTERNYNSHKDKRFGVVICCDKEGGCVHQLMNWMNARTETSVNSECLNESKTLTDTNHTFGMPSMVGKRSVAELMHGYTPKNILGLTDPHSTPFHDNHDIGNQCVNLAEQERIVRALVKKQLRDKRYNRGPDLAAVLCDLANGEQYITEAVAQAVYEAFEPPLDDELRELLFDVIRGGNARNAVDKTQSEPVESREDGTSCPKIINWRLMAKILDYERFQLWERPFEHDCINNAQCVLQSSECAETTRLRIANAIKARSKVLSTTNQAYQGDRNGLINSSLWKPLGFSTRDCEATDLSYKNRRRGQTCVPTGHSSVCTPLLGRYDDCKRRMFVPRTKEEIKKIFEEIGLKEVTEEGCSVEKIWSLAKQLDRTNLALNTATCSDADRVTLASIQQALNQCNREQIEAKVAEKYKNCCVSTLVATNKGLLI
ncbi:hypothetical protein TSMEX_001174 [Taenia solium]|eukprot:TsM_000674900 transcript=TsM_000674900 gene=TsM_000674900